MQIESLKVFCDLAETESFTKAAQINEVTQSAVSQQISSLERQFKSMLIERSKKKFLKAYPTVNVHVEYRRSNQVYDDVLSNVVDLGLVAYPARDSKLDVQA